MEKFLLRALLTGEELNVVDNKHVHAAVTLAEVLAVASRVRFAEANCVDKVVGELFASAAYKMFALGFFCLMLFAIACIM